MNNNHKSVCFSRLLKEEPLKEWLSKFAFSYAGSEISIAEKGYFSFVEFLFVKGLISLLTLY